MLASAGVTTLYVVVLVVLRLVEDHLASEDATVLSDAIRSSDAAYHSLRTEAEDPVQRFRLASMAHALLLLSVRHSSALQHGLEYEAGFDVNRRKRRLEGILEQESARLVPNKA